MPTSLDLNRPSPAWTETICPQSNLPRRTITQSDGQSDPITTPPSPSPRHPLKRSVSWASSSNGSPTTSVILFPTQDDDPIAIPKRTSSSPTPILRNRNRRRRSGPSSPPLPPSAEWPALRGQASGAELDPIFECRLFECDGARRAREAKEAQEARERALSRTGDGGSEDKSKENRLSVPGFEFTSSGMMSVESVSRSDQTTGTVKKRGAKTRTKTETDKRTTGVFDDPFSAVVALLVIFLCPPLGLHLTYRETGERDRAGVLWLCTLLWIAGVIPGVVFAVVVFFEHLPKPREPGGKRVAT